MCGGHLIQYPGQRKINFGFRSNSEPRSVCSWLYCR